MMWLAFWPVRLLDGVERTRANAAGALPDLPEANGLADVQETAALRTAFGTLRLIRARR